MYCKRVMILQQSDKRFACRGRELCGMVKLVNNSASDTVVTVFVANADNGGFGEWWLLLSFAESVFVKRLPDLNNRVFSLPVQQLDDVGCLLVKKEKRCYEVARASLGNASLCDKLLRNMDKLVDYVDVNAPRQNESQVSPAVDSMAATDNAAASVAAANSARAAVGGEATDEEYKPYVSKAADNYANLDLAGLRTNADGRYKSVEDYSEAFERFYAVGGGADYYKQVSKEIGRLFVEFPPYYPLIKKYPESFFVRIDFPSSERYFVFGVLQREGKVRYICYGLPAEKEGFYDKDFVYVDSSPTSFWMLFQDGDTGAITTLPTPV